MHVHGHMHAHAHVCVGMQTRTFEITTGSSAVDNEGRTSGCGTLVASYALPNGSSVQQLTVSLIVANLLMCLLGCALLDP